MSKAQTVEPSGMDMMGKRLFGRPQALEKQPLVGGSTSPSSAAKVVGESLKMHESVATGAVRDACGDDAPDTKSLLSGVEIYIHTIKLTLGVGILSLSYAFSFSGLATGVCLLAFMGAAVTHCMCVLADCTQHLQEQYGRQQLDYGEVGQFAMLNLPEPFRKRAHIGRKVINFMLVANQFGICCVYQLFIAKTFNQVLKACDVETSHIIIMLILFPFFVLFSFVRELKTLVPFSAAANFLQFTSLALMLQYIVRNLRWDEVRQTPFNANDFAVFFGLVMFPLEGTAMIIPLKNKAAKGEGFNKVVTLALLTDIIVFIIVGSLGYIAFPNHPKGSLTLTLPSAGETKYLPNIIAKLYYPVAIFFLYFLQLYVVSKMADDHLARRYEMYRKSKWPGNALRTALVLSSALIAAVVPKVALLASLVGAFGGSGIGLIFPSLIHIATFWKNQPRWILAKNIFLALLGTVGALLGSFAVLRKI